MRSTYQRYAAVIGRICAGSVLFVLLIANIAASQWAFPLFEPLVSGNVDAAVVFVRGFDTPERISFYSSRFEALYGSVFIRKLNTDTLSRKALLVSLNDILAQYPYNPEVLYYLSVLNRQLGNEEIASDYLKNALAIDPDVENRLRAAY